MWVAVVITALMLFGVGVYMTRNMVGYPIKSGLVTVLIGKLSALVGYAFGALVKLPPTS